MPAKRKPELKLVEPKPAPIEKIRFSWRDIAVGSILRFDGPTDEGRVWTVTHVMTTQGYKSVDQTHRTDDVLYLQANDGEVKELTANYAAGSANWTLLQS